jgi:DNA-binding NarL/FixJ family response regulator
MKRPRVLLTGGSSILRATFEKLLESECELVGTAADLPTLLSLASRHKPDIIVLDVSLPALEVHKVADRLLRLIPDAKLLVLAETRSIDQVREAFRQGATGYLLKTSKVQELTQAIGTMLRGRAYVTPLITENLADSWLREANKEKPLLALTPRQQEVLRLLMEGNSMRQIATILKVSPRTVAFHKYRIMSRLGSSSSVELIRYAIKHGIDSDWSGSTE